MQLREAPMTLRRRMTTVTAPIVYALSFAVFDAVEVWFWVPVPQLAADEDLSVSVAADDLSVLDDFAADAFELERPAPVFLRERLAVPVLESSGAFGFPVSDGCGPPVVPSVTRCLGPAVSSGTAWCAGASLRPAASSAAI